MSFLGSVPAFNSNTLASSTNVPAAASNPLELEDSTTKEIVSLDFHNSTGSPVDVYLGANTALKLLCVVPGLASGMVSLPRQPIAIPAGSRISVRASAGAALATGSFIINGWV